MMLEYRDPRREKRRGIRQLVGAPFKAYVNGIAFGAVLLACVLIEKVPGVIEELLVAVLVFVLCSFSALLAAAMHAVRERLASEDAAPARVGRRMLGPLVTALYYPSAHALFCKIAALATGSETYATRVSPYQFLPIWLLLGAALTAVTWKAPPLGEVRLDWTLAGIAAPISAWAFAEGARYLVISATATASAMPERAYPWVLLAMFFGVPFIVGVTFAPVRPAALPVISSSEAAEIAARIESATIPPP
jgi:hypothetical protein